MRGKIVGLVNRHRIIDARSLAFGQAVADRVKANPELLDKARSTLDRWMTTCSPRARTTLEEWRQALDGPLSGVIALLTAEDERAIRLRQSNPFAGLLPAAERNRILMQFQSHDAAAT